MSTYSLVLLGSLGIASAFPWVASMPGVDSSLFKREPLEKRQSYAYGTCPNNPNHTGAAPYTAPYTYSGAANGLPGSQKGGLLVPAKGDTAHYYTAAGANDIRGPCPGLNAAANHNFLSHDGITTFNELVDAQQNVYNVGYDLAVLLAVLGVGLDGDPITTRLSIGCDATSRTSQTGGTLGAEPGLNTHNKFEGDTSLSRNDFFPAKGDNYDFNGTLFESMRKTCNNNFDQAGLSKYRYQRYQESLATNENFYFGPKSLLLYGAASFLYELFPSYGNTGTPDLATISSFFGAYPSNAKGSGGWVEVGERIPANWFSRVAPYTILDVANEIRAQYMAYPVLFGGNVGRNNFDALSTPFGIIQDGKIPSSSTAADFTCLLYQLATENTPSSLSSVAELPLEVVEFATSKLNPIFENFGCPLKIV